MLQPNASIVILTGAGISAESGIETFRSATGLWASERIEDVCTPGALRRNPNRVHEFYNKRRREIQKPEIQPNAAHKALARLQREWAGSVTLITQNIDNLHERGGSENVIHMHGRINSLYCRFRDCAHQFETWDDCTEDTPCPACTRTSALRPDIVFFEEMPYHMERINAALDDADLFVSIGTSGNVYPAAGFVMQCRGHGAITAEVNLEASLNHHHFHQGYYGPATQQVPLFVDKLLTLKL